jgi:hypothetical protein
MKKIYKKVLQKVKIMSTTSRSQSAIELRPRCAIALYHPENNKVIEQQIANLSFGLDEIIQIRELDKRYTHANPRKGRCNMEECTNFATHWITRNNANYCQSDMACNQHALIWMQVKDLISDSSSVHSK